VEQFVTLEVTRRQGGCDIGRVTGIRATYGGAGGVERSVGQVARGRRWSYGSSIGGTRSSGTGAFTLGIDRMVAIGERDAAERGIGAVADVDRPRTPVLRHEVVWLGVVNAGSATGAASARDVTRRGARVSRPADVDPVNPQLEPTLW
jgi:hypothetical protein